MCESRTIVFWNVERLFEPHDSVIRHSVKPSQLLTQEQVNEKIKIIGATLSDISEKAGKPLLIGLAEVQTPNLAEHIAREVRGVKLEQIDKLKMDRDSSLLDAVDITLLYDSEFFGKVESVQSYILDRTYDNRDVLEVRFAGSSKRSPLVVLVTHWPSRLISEGNLMRISAAHYLRGLVTRTLRLPSQDFWNSKTKDFVIPDTKKITDRAEIPLIVMGDFNDEPFDQSLELLRTTGDLKVVANQLNLRGQNPREFFENYIASVPYLANPFWKYIGDKTGTFYRSPRWRIYDQILLSQGFLTNDPKAPVYEPDNAFIHSPIKIPYADGAEIAVATPSGKPKSFDPNTNEGCSDHFPVYIKVEW
jgi:endonuclease/exonuclease/phosphatase family metal-dependent hydrolase